MTSTTVKIARLLDALDEDDDVLTHEEAVELVERLGIDVPALAERIRGLVAAANARDAEPCQHGGE